MENNIFTKLKSMFTARGRSEAQLLDQRYVNLSTTYEKMKLDSGRVRDSGEIAARIDGLLKEEKDWDNANQIEQFLIPMYSKEELETEIKIRLLDAKRKLTEVESAFYESELQNANGTGKESLLSNLNKNLQWAYDIEELGKDYTTKTRIRTSLLFILSIFMFFMVNQVPFIRDLLNTRPGEKADLIVTAMASGWMGTSFSMLISLKSRVQISSISDLKVIHRFDYILSRALIGMISGLLLFYAFQSGILEGTFFPQFPEEVARGATEEAVLLNDKGMALLIIWCFISGFSEKLVPDLLTKTEKQVTQE